MQAARWLVAVALSSGLLVSGWKSVEEVGLSRNPRE